MKKKKPKNRVLRFNVVWYIVDGKWEAFWMWNILMWFVVKCSQKEVKRIHTRFALNFQNEIFFMKSRVIYEYLGSMKTSYVCFYLYECKRKWGACFITVNSNSSLKNICFFMKKKTALRRLICYLYNKKKTVSKTTNGVFPVYVLYYDKKTCWKSIVHLIKSCKIVLKPYCCFLFFFQQ